MVDRTRPLDYEVFSVQEVEGLEAETTRKMIFRPLYHTRNNDEGNHGRYFHCVVSRADRQKAPAAMAPEPLYRLGSLPLAG